MTPQEFTEKLEKKIKSLTAKEVIMAMVNGLRNPKTIINMKTYGYKDTEDETVCYGCAATNAVIELMKDETPEPQRFLPFKDYEDASLFGMGFSHFAGPRSNIESFERGIDGLRSADIKIANCDFYDFNITITNHKGINLPKLTNKYTEADLQKYEDLANSQLCCGGDAIDGTDGTCLNCGSKNNL